MEIFASNIKCSRYSSIDRVLGSSTRTISNSKAIFFKKDNGCYIIQFKSNELRWADNTILPPILTALVQFGIIDAGGQQTLEYIEREMRLLPSDARFVFVGDYVGAVNALDVFIHLPYNLRNKVDEIHLMHYIPTKESLKHILDEQVEKVFLI